MKSTRRELSLEPNGYILPYTLFLVFIILNIVIFTTSLYFSELKSYQNKLNYYQVYILEERAIRHSQQQINDNKVTHLLKETLEYQDSIVYLTYYTTYSEGLYQVEIIVVYNQLRERSVMLYTQHDTDFDYIK